MSEDLDSKLQSKGGTRAGMLQRQLPAALTILIAAAPAGCAGSVYVPRDTAPHLANMQLLAKGVCREYARERRFDSAMQCMKTAVKHYDTMQERHGFPAIDPAKDFFPAYEASLYGVLASAAKLGRYVSTLSQCMLNLEDSNLWKRAKTDQDVERLMNSLNTVCRQDIFSGIVEINTYLTDTADLVKQAERHLNFYIHKKSPSPQLKRKLLNQRRLAQKIGCRIEAMKLTFSTNPTSPVRIGREMRRFANPDQYTCDLNDYKGYAEKLDDFRRMYDRFRQQRKR